MFIGVTHALRPTGAGPSLPNIFGILLTSTQFDLERPISEPVGFVSRGQTYPKGRTQHPKNFRPPTEDLQQPNLAW